MSDNPAIDRKFRIMAVNPCKMHRVYDEHNSILFCAHDKALPAAINAYINECTILGCNPEHIESMEMALERVMKFQEDHPELAKVPDTDTQCEIDRCVGGVGVD